MRMTRRPKLEPSAKYALSIKNGCCSTLAGPPPPVDVAPVADPEDQVPLVGTGVDDSIIPRTEAKQPRKLSRERLSRSSFPEQRLLDPAQNPQSRLFPEPP